MEIVSRSKWGARAPKSVKTVPWSARTEFVVHHSEGPTDQTIKSIQNFHMDTRGWSDVGYNFLVRDDGTIYEGRGWTKAGAHAHQHNTSGIGVCYIGYNKPTQAAKRAIRELYDYACDKAGRTLAKRGHGQLSGNSTDCPGSALLAWVKGGMVVAGDQSPSKDGIPSGTPLLRVGSEGQKVKDLQTALNRAVDAKLVVDGDFGEKTRAAVIKLQKRAGLEPDGIYGPNSATALGVILEV